MSGKIRAKDLSYDSTLPPFLQRLHAQNAGHADAERQQRAIARPKRARETNDEDEPTVIDESGETLSKAQIEEMSKDGERASGKAAGASDGAARVEHKINSVGPQKKRKVVKVIGAEDGPTEKEVDVKLQPAKKVKKVKQKTNTIKLAFDDGEGT